MKIEINLGILMVVAIFVTVMLITLPIGVVNSFFPFGLFTGTLVITTSFLLRKKLVYNTKKRKIERLK